MGHASMSGHASVLEARELPPWWKRPELLLLLAVYLTAIWLRSTALPLAGEETRRALYARHVAHGGDWAVVPRGLEPFYDRPPGHYWLMAAASELTGRLDPLTIRIVSLVATGLTTLLIYWFAAGVLGRAGSFVAAVSFVTTGYVLEIGRRGETEPLFVLLVAASLFVWHHGWRRGWRPVLTWSAGCVVMSLAALTKGLQAPVTFFGATWIWLLFRRDRRMLLHPGQLAGMALATGIVAVWQIPFLARTSWSDVVDVWLGQAARRAHAGLPTALWHLASFPIELLVAMLPWSVLLAGMASRHWRPSDEPRRCVMSFMLIAAVVIATPVWVVPEARHRYAMPLYPFASVLCGMVVEQALLTGETRLSRLWRDFLRGTAVAMTGVALVFGVATVARSFVDGYWIRTLAQPAWVAAGAIASAIIVTALLWRLAPRRDLAAAVVSSGLLALLLGAMSNGPILNAHVENAANVGAEIGALRDALPAGTLVSFGSVNHKFAYHWERPIRIVPWPARAEAISAGTCFAFDHYRDAPRAALPFAWEKLGEFNMERTRVPDPAVTVVVGRAIARDAALRLSVPPFDDRIARRDTPATR